MMEISLGLVIVYIILVIVLINFMFVKILGHSIWDIFTGNTNQPVKIKTSKDYNYNEETWVAKSIKELIKHIEEDKKEEAENKQDLYNEIRSIFGALINRIELLEKSISKELSKND